MTLPIILFVLLTSSAVISFEHDEISSKIHPNLHESLSLSKRENVFVSMKDGSTRPILQNLNFNPNASKTERSEGVYNALSRHATRSQGSTLNFLSNWQGQRGFSVESFWVSNRIYIQNAPSTLIHGLSLLPQVANIEKEALIELDDFTFENQSANFERQNRIEWNIQKIQADRVWSMRDGTRGEGIIVAIADTGVRGTHEALRDNYVGKENFGFYDSINGKEDVYDDHGHGTHCCGIAVGKGGIGVAPGAKWMACKLIGNGRSKSGRSDVGISRVEKCAEFFICPTSPDGARRDCSKAPHIVSNSWVSGRGTSGGYDDSIEAYRKAGIIPVFGAGNDGPNCETMRYPAGSPRVIGVGSTDQDDGLSRFSSVGPAAYRAKAIKPDIVAPGGNIRSSSWDSDNKYVGASGTSMACPHTAGMIALMLSRNKGVDYERVKSILFETAQKKLKFKNAECSRKNDSTFPNYHFGNGRIDALEAVKKVNQG